MNIAGPGFFNFLVTTNSSLRVCHAGWVVNARVMFSETQG